ncbi:hypothetical protein LOAG_11633, partial [Loa loa]
ISFSFFFIINFKIIIINFNQIKSLILILKLYMAIFLFIKSQKKAINAHIQYTHDYLPENDTHTHTYTCTHIHTRAHTHTHTYIYTYSHIHIRKIDTDIHIYTHTRTNTHISHIYAHAHT